MMYGFDMRESKIVAESLQAYYFAETADAEQASRVGGVYSVRPDVTPRFSSSPGSKLQPITRKNDSKRCRSGVVSGFDPSGRAAASLPHKVYRERLHNWVLDSGAGTRGSRCLRRRKPRQVPR